MTKSLAQQAIDEGVRLVTLYQYSPRRASERVCRDFVPRDEAGEPTSGPVLSPKGVEHALHARLAQRFTNVR